MRKSVSFRSAFWDPRVFTRANHSHTSPVGAMMSFSRRVIHNLARSWRRTSAAYCQDIFRHRFDKRGLWRVDSLQKPAWGVRCVYPECNAADVSEAGATWQAESYFRPCLFVDQVRWDTAKPRAGATTGSFVGVRCILGEKIKPVRVELICQAVLGKAQNAPLAPK